MTPYPTTCICSLSTVVVRLSLLTREVYVVFYESRLQLINYIFALYRIAHHIGTIMDQRIN